eukprot:703549-Amphidinium_carterae.2
MPRWSADSHGAKRARQVRHIDLNVLTLHIRSLAETGKLLFAARRLEQLKVDIGCFQETRLKDELPVESAGEYSVFINPASRFKGGLAILVRKGRCVLSREMKCYSPWVMRVEVQYDGYHLQVINAHAPITEATPAEHSEFAAVLADAVRDARSRGKIIVCTDLNARSISSTRNRCFVTYEKTVEESLHTWWQQATSSRARGYWSSGKHLPRG